MPSLYEMARGPDIDLYGQFMAGRELAQGDQFNRFKLADLQRGDMARAFAGPALSGDQGAFGKLMALDPGMGLRINDQQLQQKRFDRELTENDLATIGKVAVGADTPEKWAAAMDFLQAQGFDIDDDDRNFANRQTILDATASGGQGFTLSPGASRYDAAGNLMATAPGRPAGGRRRTQVVAIGGRQVLTDLDTGESIQDLGEAPSRLRVANTDQNNAAGFYDRLVDADKVLSDPGVIAAATDYAGKAKANIPLGIGNYLASPEYQLYDQAQRNFINAVLRKESGAAIAQSEFDNAAVQYFPQPGDTPEKIAQKAQNRATVIAAMKRTAGPALLQNQPAAPPTQPYPGADGITPDDQGGTFDNGAIDDAELEAAMQEALDAIAQGADPAAVKQELINMGADPDVVEVMINAQ